MWKPLHFVGYPKRLFTGFVGVVLIGACVASLFLIDSFRSYSADTDLLISPKSEQGAIETMAVRDSLRIIGSQRDFFLEVNDEADISEISFEEIGVGALRVIVIGSQPIDARDGVGIVTRELFSRIGKYYDIRDDIAIRSLGTPQVRASIAHPLFFLALSVMFGIFIAFVFFAVILSAVRIGFFLQNFRQNDRNEYITKNAALPERFRSRKAETEIPPSLSSAFVPKKIEQSFFSFEPSGISSQSDYAHFHRGPAPANLPIALDDAEPLPDFLSGMTSTDIPVKEKIVPIEDIPPVVLTPDEMIAEESNTPLAVEPSDREPSVEEYKRRLNELLRGDMPGEK